MNKDILNYNSEGFYGDFGGAFIPEILYKNISDLKKWFEVIRHDASFVNELEVLLKNYVGRPSPLYYAKKLGEKYNTNIFLKREDLNHTGAHKINNALGSALLAKRMGKTRLIAETGAGQHGVATATVAALLEMDCVVYMGKLDVERQQPNVKRMKMLGATVVPVTSGNMTLKDATNEAIRDWCCNPRDSFYIIGSTVGPHPYPAMVAFFQSVISRELSWQIKEEARVDFPDAIIACIGGGSNAAGAFYHFIDNPAVRLIAAEAAGKGIDTTMTAASMTIGRPGVLHGSLTMLMQDDDGQIIEPYSVSAGLDYPGVGPLHAHLAKTGREEVIAITDDEALNAAMLLTRTEGIIPALESAHALAVLDKLKFGQNEKIIINLSGRGDKDMETYLKYFEKEK